MNDEAIDSECVRLGVEPEKAGQLKQLQASKAMSPPEVKDYLLNVRPQIGRLFEVWDSTSMKHMTLTSVGIAIACANIKRRTSIHFDLSIWL